MATSEFLVNRTTFGTLVRYLHHPQSPITHLLHVRDPAMLSDLATRLQAALAGNHFKPRAVAMVQLGETLASLFLQPGLDHLDRLTRQ